MAAQTVTLTADSTTIAMFVTAACSVYGYQASSDLTQGQFAKQCLINYMKSVAQQYQRQQNAVAAQQQADQTVNNQFTTNPVT